MMMQLLVASLVLALSARAVHCACVSNDLTRDQRLELIGDTNDHNGDGIVKFSDVAYDINHNYDANKDGVVTEEEWIARWTCAFGDSQYFARFVWTQLNGGHTTVRAADFNVVPFSTTGVPRAQFIEMNKQRYEAFHARHCINRHLSVEEKLSINFRDNDHDNNHKVTTADIAYNLDNDYDTNGDKIVDKAEFVQEWTCAYADTAAYADFVWGLISRGHDTISGTDQRFLDEPFKSGEAEAAFKQRNRQRYENYASQVPIGK